MTPLPDDTANLRFTSGASVSPDAHSVAYLVDDGGYPHVVERALLGRTAGPPCGVNLPVVGPVTRVQHSEDGKWLACQVAPDAGTRTQVWAVPCGKGGAGARRLDRADDSSTELVGWDGSRVAVTASDENGVSEARVIDPESGTAAVLDRRVGGHLVDSWDGSALLRVGPRGHRELLFLRADGSYIPLLPADVGSTTDAGVILDDHGQHHSALQPGSPWTSTEGEPAQFVRAVVRSDHGTDFARLLGVAVSDEGVSYRLLAERTDAELDEFAVSEDHTIVALLWNCKGSSELQILNLSDGTTDPPLPLPGPVASQPSLSANGSVLAVTVEGPGMPPSVELVNPRSGDWNPVEHARTRVEPANMPMALEFIARDGLPLSGWWYRGAGGRPGPVLLYLHGGPEAQERPGFSDYFPALTAAGISVFAPNVRGSGGFGRRFSHADDRYGRFAAIDDVADCVHMLVERELAAPGGVACAGRSYGGYLTLAALTFHAPLFATGIAICGMSDLESFYAHTEPWIAAAAYPKYGHPEADRELLQELSPIHRIDDLTAPLLVVHGAHDTNVPVSESRQIVEAVRARGGIADFLLFDDEGHEIVTRENRARLATAMVDWLTVHLAVPQEMS
ncbi:alpha/beta hydrolase family protein [Rhodococcus chondri]|uniref:Prolyl oligopeptidase family serine peptidase n=1 Tax=Rhodococcus chondri TaxID=3065941 RepID=A0ABU7JRR7_9NOCA|nr:prolyl oligopeptidase family serine peptidase [Rhodococcus sp. CC-R104]MEE2032713.1 prolyl oligopeptidase family serine peptidase [Rhodococcus sp. CC-R104]